MAGRPMREAFGTPGPRLGRTLGIAAVLALLVLGYVPFSGGASPAVSAPHAPAGTVVAPTHVAGSPPPAHRHAAPPTATATAPTTVPSGSWTPASRHTPASWRGASSPPGGQVLSRALHQGAGSVGTPLAPAHPAGNLSHPFDPHGYCYGIWPSEGGQETYTNNCYGHDEPGIQFYSTLGGSGGNVTWNITLPVSHDPYNTQSDLYTAIWFGMTLSDPFAWMDQCFLELQFYPDSDWYSSGSVFGSWVGAAVAWQIEAASGYENACFYQPLDLNGSFNEFRMSDGDQITVAMNGWIGDPYGEKLTLTDRTSGQVSVVTLYNSAQNYPLDPAYTTSTWPNGLQWTPGGELPVVFAFETGHTVPPYPNTNGYGGCSSGPPPSSAVDPAVPCPSYDPASWNNDTVQPWYIGVPTFSNATASETPTQVSFTQDLGGISFIDPLSNYTCSGRDGSAWCSYPWYSYSCGVHAFEFGATDYPGVSADFGAYLQYAQNYVYDAAQFAYVPPTNFSIPTCGGPSYSVFVGSWNGNGSAYFLSQPVPGLQDFPGLGPGEYAISAIPRAGYEFASWEGNGSFGGPANLTVANPLDPTTTLWVVGNGTMRAQFVPTVGSPNTVTFHDAPTSGRIVVLSGFLYTTGIPIGTYANGGMALLGSGIYSIQAYPPSGYNFTGWTVVGGGAVVAAPSLPFTWLDLPNLASGVSLTAHYAASVSKDTVYYSVYYGSGTVSFNGGLATVSGSSTVSVGTYSLVANPSAGNAFAGWYVSSSAVLIDFGATTNITLEEGTTYYLYAEFEPLLRVVVTPVGTGQASLDGAAPLEDQSTFVYATYHTIYAVPASGYAVSSITASDSTAIWLYGYAGSEFFLVNDSATITITMTSAAATSLSFSVLPAGGGTIQFNHGTCADGSTNSTLAPGPYFVSENPSPGYNFTGWTLSAGLSWYNGFLDVTSTGGTLSAQFTPGLFPVTFTTSPSVGPIVTVSTGVGPGLAITNGETVLLSGSADVLSATLLNGQTVGGWTASPSIVLGPGASPTIAVHGPATIGLFTRGFGLSAGVTPTTAIDLGLSVTFWATAVGSGAFTFLWSGLPAGCTGRSVPSWSCTPTAIGWSNVSVNVTAYDGTQHETFAGTVIVVPALLERSFAATPTNFTIGGSTQLSVAYTGGVSPIHFQYTGLPPGCASVDASALLCTPNGTGRIDVTVQVSDPAGQARFGSLELNVNPVPSVTAFLSNPALSEVGVNLSLSLVTGGGTAPLGYTYAGLPAGCLSIDGPTLTCRPTVAAQTNVTVTVTDADGYSALGTVALRVAPALSLTATFGSPAEPFLNDSYAIAVGVSGGVAPFHFVYHGLPAGCLGRDTPQLNCTLIALGNYSMQVTVTDHLGVVARAFQNVTVAPPTVGPPSPGGSSGGFSLSPTTVLELAGIGVVVAVALAAVLLTQRRRPPEGPVTTVSEAESEELTPGFYQEPDPPSG